MYFFIFGSIFIFLLTLTSCGRKETCPAIEIIESGEYMIEYDFTDEAGKLSVSYKDGKANIVSEGGTTMLFLSDGVYSLHNEDKTYSKDLSSQDFRMFFWEKGTLQCKSAQETNNGVIYICTRKNSNLIYQFHYVKNECVQLEIICEMDGYEVIHMTPTVVKFCDSVSSDVLFNIPSDYVEVTDMN